MGTVEIWPRFMHLEQTSTAIAFSANLINKVETVLYRLARILSLFVELSARPRGTREISKLLLSPCCSYYDIGTMGLVLVACQRTVGGHDSDRVNEMFRYV